MSSKKLLFLIINNEVPLLHDRLPTDLSVFDRVYVGEANKTFAGRSKPFFVEKYWNLFAGIERFEYIKIENLPDPDRSKIWIGSNGKEITQNRWIVEHAMRNFPMDLLDDLIRDFGSDASATVADVDEIIHQSALDRIDEGPAIFRHPLWDFRGTLRSEGLKSDKFFGPYTVKLSTVKEFGLNFSDIRRICVRTDGSCYGSTIISPGSLKNLDGSPAYPVFDYDKKLKCLVTNEDTLTGWHISDMHGGKLSILGAKIESFSHAEYSKLIDAENIVVPDIFLSLQDTNKNDDFPLTDELSPFAPKFIYEKAMFKRYYCPK